MVREFSVGFRRVEEINISVAFSIAVEGTGASLFLLSSLLGLKLGVVTGLVLVCIGVLALFSHLGRPLQFWRVVSGTNRAWVSRGAVFTAGFIGVVLISLVISWSSLPEIDIILQVLAYIGAMTVLLYTGFLFSSMASIPFWHSAMLPILFLFHSLTSGSMLAVVILSLSGESLRNYSDLFSLVLALFGATLMMTWVFTNSTFNSDAAKESARLMGIDPLRSLYRNGVLLSGFLISPLVLLACYFVPVLQNSGSILAGSLLIAGILRLGSDVIFRYCILKAGVYDRLI